MHAYADKLIRALVVFLCVMLIKLPTPSLGAQEETGSADGSEASDETPERYGGMTAPDGRYVPTATEIFGDSKTTLLVQAMWRADAKAARELIESGADVNAGGRRGVTPLQFLVVYEKIEGIELALKLGADPNQSSDGGDTPLYYALDGANWRKLLKMLINAGADVQKASESARARSPFTIEHRVMVKLMEHQRFGEPGAEVRISTAGERSGFEVLWWLLEHGGDVNALDTRRGLLWSAYLGGYPDIAYALLERGANPLVRQGGRYSFAESIIGSDSFKPESEAEAFWMEKVKNKAEALSDDQEMIRQAREIEASYAKFYESYRKTKRGAFEERMIGELDGVVDALEEEVEEAEASGD